MVDDIHERAAVLALARATGKGGDWSRMAAIVETLGSALDVIRGEWSEPPDDLIEAQRLKAAADPGLINTYVDLLAGIQGEDTSLVTVLDDGYPVNLRAVYNRPPFLFIRGRLAPEDRRAIAIVGTRQASDAGKRAAYELAKALVEAQVTVLSGLARGIDTAAHRGALDAGGRTVAVMGTGIERVYPAENRGLAEEIVASGGALVSQFWPDAPPARYTFPMRNAVMSGMAIGTVVIEASSTSGAKMQARLALEHGKRLFLLKDLVLHEEWAQTYAQRPGARVVESVDEVVEAVVLDTSAPMEQLTIG